jgi:hypothetical protein
MPLSASARSGRPSQRGIRASDSELAALIHYSVSRYIDAMVPTLSATGLWASVSTAGISVRDSTSQPRSITDSGIATHAVAGTITHDRDRHWQ